MQLSLPFTGHSYLDALISSPGPSLDLLQGTAGSGKTVLAIELARWYLSQGKRVFVAETNGDHTYRNLADTQTYIVDVHNLTAHHLKEYLLAWKPDLFIYDCMYSDRENFSEHIAGEYMKTGTQILVLQSTRKRPLIQGLVTKQEGWDRVFSINTYRSNRVLVHGTNEIDIPVI